MTIDAIEAMRARVSVRKYEARPISREVLEEIADCGRLAPTGRNEQAWTFVIITERTALVRLAEICRHGRFVADAAACICVFSRKDALCEVEDASAATENMIIAARAHGIGTCWINAHRKEHSAAVEQLLGCPEGHELVTMFSLGYPAEETRRPKKDLTEVVRWERFSS